MTAAFVAQPVVWIIVLLVLVACWPMSQALRHERLRPVAAYLLFTSVLVLVSALMFMVLVWGALALAGPALLEGAAAAAITLVLALVPGLLAARWIVSFPQARRMPK